MSTLAISQFDLNQIIIEETKRLLEEKSFVKRSTRSVVSEISDETLWAPGMAPALASSPPRVPSSSGAGVEIFMDLVQIALGSVGIFAEGPGAFADLANAGISAARGLCFEALLDLTAVIPAYGAVTGALSTLIKATRLGARNVTGWGDAAKRILKLMKEYFRTIYKSKEVLKETSDEIFKIMQLDARVVEASQTLPTKTNSLFAAKLREFVKNSEEVKSATEQAVMKKTAELRKAKAASGEFRGPGDPPFTVPREEAEKIRQEVIKRFTEKYTKSPDKLTQEQLKTLQKLREEAFNEAKAGDPIFSLDPFRAMNEKELKEALDDFFRVQGLDPTKEPEAQIAKSPWRQGAVKLKRLSLFIGRSSRALGAIILQLLNVSESVFSGINELFKVLNSGFCKVFAGEFDEAYEIFNKWRTSEPEGSQGEEEASDGSTPSAPAQTRQTGTGGSEEDPQSTGTTRQRRFGG
tara:strand:- start:1118 stop:2515 length:1398 start_codon:yes stop_codon:yes gene_type:complete